MQFLPAILLFSILSLTSAKTARNNSKDYKRRAAKHLMTGQLCKAKVGAIDGWSPLPSKASSSQCSLALQRIVKQPQSCAQSYLSGPARNVYLPIYKWFSDATDLTVVDVAVQFATDNSVAVTVYNCMGDMVANVTELGTVLALVPTTNLSYQLARTWALNFPSFVRFVIDASSPDDGTAFIAQNVWNFDSQLLTVVISKPLNVLPVVC